MSWHGVPAPATAVAASSQADALLRSPPSSCTSGRRRPIRGVLAAVFCWAAISYTVAAATVHRSTAEDKDKSNGFSVLPDIAGIDGNMLVQTRVETSAKLQGTIGGQFPPVLFAGRAQGPNGRYMNPLLSHRPRYGDINLQDRLDTKYTPFNTVAGLSDNVDIHDDKKVRHQQPLLVQAPTLMPPVVDIEAPPRSHELPRMAVTDRKSYRQAMVNFGDVQYISYITIGHQTISGILDTGSFELVVFSAVCESCGQAAKYDSTLSSTYTAGKLASGQSYGSGDTTSLEAFDQVAIGPFDEANQTFWEVFDAHMPILHHAAFQSIVGVGPPETPAADAWSNARKASDNVTEFYEHGRRPPVDARQRLSNKLTIAKEMSSKSTMLTTFKVSMFSVCVGARPGSDGYFIWNDTSALDEPEMFWKVPVVGRHTWSVQLRRVRLGQLEEANDTQDNLPLGCYEEGCGALVDSGTSLLAVPTAVINKLLMYLEGMGANCSKLGELPDLVFEMNGMSFSLPPDAYVAEVKGDLPNYLANFVRVRHLRRANGQCQLVLMESFADSSFGPLWILGVPFFRKYYTTFSVGKTKKDRSIFIASASEDCEPVGLRSSSPIVPYRRCIDPAKLYVPATVMAAATEEFVHL